MSKYLNTFYEAIDVEWPIKNIRIQLLKANNIIDPIILGMLRGGHIKKQKNTCFHGFTQKKCLGTFNKKTPRCSERKKQHEQEFNASLSSSTNAPPFFWTPKKWAFTWSPPKPGRKNPKQQTNPGLPCDQPQDHGHDTRAKHLRVNWVNHPAGHGPGTLPPPHK